MAEFTQGMTVAHDQLGLGVVLDVAGDQVTVAFLFSAQAVAVETKAIKPARVPRLVQAQIHESATGLVPNQYKDTVWGQARSRAAAAIRPVCGKCGQPDATCWIGDSYMCCECDLLSGDPPSDARYSDCRRAVLPASV